MKLLSSSPSISSSSASFDPKMCTSKSASTSGCLASILRRILCSGSLPTHPSSDHTTNEANSEANYHTKQQQVIDGDGSKVTTPGGIVARLMGLDSLPEVALLETQVNPNSITRSRSMNSADYNYKQDHHTIYGSKHRRVNSTLSFREMPTYLELENDEFFILSFEKELVRSSKEKKEELKQIKEDEQGCKGVLKELDEEKLNRGILEKPKSNEVVIRNAANLRKKNKKKKKKKMQQLVKQIVESECISEEDSSPVSVLDFDQFIIDHDVLTSEEDSPALEINYGCKYPSKDGNLKEDDQRVINIIGGKNLECWDAICRMIEGEVAKSSWLRSDHHKDVTEDFGSKILDQLLDELVVQLF